MGGRGQKSIGKRERTTEDRFGPMKISPELKALDEYLHNHPDFERYNKIEALESEMSRIINAKKGVLDTTGDDRLDEIEKELVSLNRYEPYFENRRLDVAQEIGRQFVDMTQLRWFKKSPHYSEERARKAYKNAIDDGFNSEEARRKVLDAQKTVERMAKTGVRGRNEGEVTSSTYERAQRKLDKRVRDWIGKR